MGVPFMLRNRVDSTVNLYILDVSNVNVPEGAETMVTTAPGPGAHMLPFGLKSAT